MRGVVRRRSRTEQCIAEGDNNQEEQEDSDNRGARINKPSNPGRGAGGIVPPLLGQGHTTAIRVGRVNDVNCLYQRDRLQSTHMKKMTHSNFGVLEANSDDAIVLECHSVCSGRENSHDTVQSAKVHGMDGNEKMEQGTVST